MNNSQNVEKRSYSGLEIRMHDEDNREIEGYGIVFNKRFEIWDGYYEEIAPEAGDYFQNSDIDVISAFNHNFDKVLGRSSAGTMRFEVDETGVKYIVQVAPTTAGNDLLESVKRGDIKGSSFVFTAKKVQWEDSEEETIRRIQEFGMVIEMGPVVFPAYKDTTVAKRSLENYQLEKQQSEEESMDQTIALQHIHRQRRGSYRRLFL
jgi:HK97 family phage prohead protease